MVDDENRYVVTSGQRQQGFESLVVLLVGVGSPPLARPYLRQGVDHDQAGVRRAPQPALYGLDPALAKARALDRVV